MMHPRTAAIDHGKSYTNNRQRILALGNAFAGQQGVVLCPGPSIKNTDLTLLVDHPYVMGVNGVFLLRNRFKFYFCSSPNFFVPNMVRISEVIADVFFLSSFIRQVVELLPAELQDKTIFLEVDKAQMAARRMSDEFHFDLTRTLSWGPTVLLDIVLPALVWMGFCEIVLVGADYPRQGYRRFYSGRSDAPRTLVESDHDAEMAMAHRRFDQLLWTLMTLPTPVRIVNCSPNSELMQLEQGVLKDVVERRRVQDFRLP
jgi:hypothetical protein